MNFSANKHKHTNSRGMNDYNNNNNSNVNVNYSHELVCQTSNHFFHSLEFSRSIQRSVIV